VTIVQWWLIPVWIVVAALAVALAVVLSRRRRRTPDGGVPVAHTERLTRLPGYRRAITRYRALLAGLAVALLIGFVASAALSTRVASSRVESTDLATRDIVLCFDVSGSMIDYDAEVVSVFSDLAERFEGERLSLVVFNASAVTYFPLTTDLGYIQDQFARIQKDFASPEKEYFDGTLFGNGSSLVGDGLASCVTRFPEAEADRSRSVILVTDNLVAGEEVFTLPEAAGLASDRGVRVYGINPGDSAAKSYLDDLATQFEDAVTSTGGAYYALDDPDAIPEIVTRITAEQAAVTAGPTRVVLDDRTTLATWLVLAALVAVFALAWVVRR
jgi:hypothetical protein